MKIILHSPLSPEECLGKLLENAQVMRGAWAFLPVRLRQTFSRRPFLAHVKSTHLLLERRRPWRGESLFFAVKMQQAHEGTEVEGQLERGLADTVMLYIWFGMAVTYSAFAVLSFPIAFLLDYKTRLLDFLIVLLSLPFIPWLIVVVILKINQREFQKEEDYFEHLLKKALDATVMERQLQPKKHVLF